MALSEPACYDPTNKKLSAPTGRTLLAPAAAPTSTQTVTQVAQATPSLSTLVEALTRTGLAGEICHFSPSAMSLMLQYRHLMLFQAG